MLSLQACSCDRPCTPCPARLISLLTPDSKTLRLAPSNQENTPCAYLLRMPRPPLHTLFKLRHSPMQTWHAKKGCFVDPTLFKTGPYGGSCHFKGRSGKGKVEPNVQTPKRVVGKQNGCVLLIPTVWIARFEGHVLAAITGSFISPNPVFRI